jgi:hypothetical protein
VRLVCAAWARKEAAALQEQCSELQLKLKALVVQARLASQAEIKILLTKVDAVYNQIAQLERAHGEAQQQIQTLELTKKSHQRKLGSMVPGTDLESAKGDLAQKAELINSLHKRLQESQEEIDKLTRAMQVDCCVIPESRCRTLLKFSWQGMVGRSELASAQSEAKAFKEEAEAKVKDLEWKEGQLTRAQEQLKSARSEAAQLQVAMSGMVSKSELFVTRAESEKLREAIAELQDATKKLEDDKSELVKKMQVKRLASAVQQQWSHSRFIIQMHFRNCCLFLQNMSPRSDLYDARCCT